MQLHERLIDLIGHEVSVGTLLEGKAAGVSSGVVKEVHPRSPSMNARTTAPSVG